MDAVPATNPSSCVEGIPEPTSPPGKYHSHSVRAIEKPVRIRKHDAIKKLSKIRSLRCFLPKSISMGGIGNQLNLLHTWQTLSPDTLKQVELVVPDRNIVPEKLKTLFGYLERPKKNQKVMIGGTPCTLIELSQVQTLPASQLAIAEYASQAKANNDINLKDTNSQGCLVITPYHWSLDDNSITYLKETGITQQALHMPEENHLPVNETKLARTKDIADMFQAHGSMAQYWQTLIQQAEQGSIHFSTVYGLHDGGKYLFQSYIKAVDNLKQYKPSVIFITNNLKQSDITHFTQDLYHPGIHIHTTMPSVLSKEQTEQQPEPGIHLLFHGGLPKPVFEKMVSVSNLPVILEGANTAELAQSLGKPYLGIQRTENMPSGRSTPNEHQNAFSLWQTVTTLLHTMEGQANACSKAYETFIQTFEPNLARTILDQAIRKQNNDDKQRHPTFGMSLRLIELTTDTASEKVLKEFLSQLNWLTKGVNNKELILCDLIPAFQQGLPAISHPVDRTFQKIQG